MVTIKFPYFQINKVHDDESGEIVDVELSDSDISNSERFPTQVEFIFPNKSKVQATKGSKKNRKPIKTKTPKSSQDKSESCKNEDREAAPTVLESSVSEVSKRLASGCECQGVCFNDLQAESVYRHRLNIAELTKQEHDMYLMGVTMACLSNRNETNRHKERIRQRAVYVFQGKRVCLDAFIYLENVTQYHLKRIRRHVMVNGVIPRVHGNVRKKPHNALSLDVYKFAENFVKSELSQHTNELNKSIIVVNEPRINLYHKFRLNCPADSKSMSYSTFRHFLKKQFPHVRFVVNRPLDNSRAIKQERRQSRARVRRKTAISNDRILNSEAHKMYEMTEYDTEAASDYENLDETEEICVEFIANDEESCDSDINDSHNVKFTESKANEYQDIDFLESEDE